MELKSLIEKYSTPGPRYTSYPTVPHWTESIGPSEYTYKLKNCNTQDAFAVYLHIPYCEQLCYYCGCNMLIRKKKDGVAQSYLSLLQREIQRVTELLSLKRTVNQLSIGGGTPTYLTPQELVQLKGFLDEGFNWEAGAELSIEVDPRVTTYEHLRTLRGLGFNRISLGIQDFSTEVQKAVNRIQPEASTEEFLHFCRSLGFSGINFDLMYGLPFQTVQSFEKTIESVISMGPDRIALYHYAHLPKMIRHQKILEKMDRPPASTRTEIFLFAFNRLLEAGYKAIGMDHFAKAHDEMSIALDRGVLYRNFMGYSIKKAPQMLGLGMSAIGEVENTYFQNHRSIKEYSTAIETGTLATMRGCALDSNDRQRRWVIQNLMCGLNLSYPEFESQFFKAFEDTFERELSSLTPLIEDGIIVRKSKSLEITQLGRLFLRNVAMFFDAYLKPTNNNYSQTL